LQTKFGRNSSNHRWYFTTFVFWRWIRCSVWEITCCWRSSVKNGNGKYSHTMARVCWKLKSIDTLALWKSDCHYYQYHCIGKSFGPIPWTVNTLKCACKYIGRFHRSPSNKFIKWCMSVLCDFVEGTASVYLQSNQTVVHYAAGVDVD